MKKTFIPLLVVGTALITGCNPKSTDNTIATTTSTPVINKADAVASVNGQYIPKSSLEELEKEIAQRSHGQTFPKEKLIEELVQRELLVQDATQKKLDKSPEVQAQLEVAKKTLLTQADLQDYLKTNPVTDEEIKAEYDSKVGSEKGTEYKARHILVKTEKEAKDLIVQLDKGADFGKLANKNSLDAKESQNGGDLGWFSPAQMVAPFSEAVAKLEKGKYTKAPVQTQFGFHIILREDSREQTPPPLDAVKEQLKPFLQRKKIQTLLESLRKQAKVEILVPLVDEKPKAEAAAADAAVAAAAGSAATPAAEPAPDAAKPAETAPAAVEKPAEAIKPVEKAEEKAAPATTEKAAAPAEAKK
ncbi:MAG: peptidylprolyl isomerase [Methylococcaceae bacterium]|nr:peptidylprolyl isomerase [Methylococcaceae bacterium]